MTKKALWILVLIFIVLTTASLILLENSLSVRLLWWGINLDIHNFKLVSFSKDNTNISEVEKLEASSATARVFIDRTKIGDHNKYIEDKKFLLTSLFEPTTSPYPEVITNIIECADEFKPKVRNANNGEVYTLFAGKRFNFGVCSKDLVKYNSEYGIFDCKKKGIFEVRVFSDGDSKIERIMKSFKC